jgi:hypothetical protein
LTQHETTAEQSYAGVRWAAAMATLNKDEAKKFGMDAEDAGRYVRLDTVKNNYAAPWDGIWLERQEGGVLVPVELEQVAPNAKTAEKAAESEDSFHATVKKMQKLVKKKDESGHPMTQRELRQYAGKGGVFNMGDHSLRGIIKRALEESHIGEYTPEGHKNPVLRTWK